MAEINNYKKCCDEELNPGFRQFYLKPRKNQGVTR